MELAVCPDDNVPLKALPRPPDRARPLLMTCPACGKRFTLTTSGVTEAAGDGEPGS
jgi:uncharacterized protein YbaR (Trm112 family)